MKTMQQHAIVKKILEKGKPINDIIFLSKKMTFLDIALMLKWCRPTKADCRQDVGLWNNLLRREDKHEYGWDTDKLYNLVDNPVLTGGGDGLQQLLFGCVAALDVYTEAEIATILNIQMGIAKP